MSVLYIGAQILPSGSPGPSNGNGPHALSSQWKVDELLVAGECVLPSCSEGFAAPIDARMPHCDNDVRGAELL